MRVLIASDIHSNLEAFQSVIEDAEKRGGFKQIWHLGDLVGYGPNPGECIDLLRQYDNRAVVGNHDLGAIGRLSLEAFNIHAAAAARWTTTQLSEDHVRFLSALPMKFESGGFTAVHGSIRDPVWEYVVSPAAAVANFHQLKTSWCLVGHSHLPFICRPQDDSAVFLDFPVDSPVALGKEHVIVSPGAVGQPRDGVPTASYVIYETVEGTVTRHRAEYDIPKTQEKMEALGLPKYLADRLARGR